MASDPFPQNSVLIEDLTSIIDLPQDKKAFVHFDFIQSQDVNCSIITRVIVGQDRNAVKAFHDNNLGNIPVPPRALSSSQLGIGQVVVLTQDGRTIQADKEFIMISDTQPGSDPRIATRVVVANKPEEMSSPDQTRFHELQLNCSTAISRVHQLKLDALRSATASGERNP